MIVIAAIIHVLHPARKPRSEVVWRQCNRGPHWAQTARARPAVGMGSWVGGRGRRHWKATQPHRDEVAAPRPVFGPISPTKGCERRYSSGSKGSRSKSKSKSMITSKNISTSMSKKTPTKGGHLELSGPPHAAALNPPPFVRWSLGGQCAVRSPVLRLYVGVILCPLADAQLGAPCARVEGHLVVRGRDGLPRQRCPGGERVAVGVFGRRVATQPAGAQQALHPSVLEGVVREHRQPPAGPHEGGGGGKEGIELIELAVDGDAQCLEDARRGLGRRLRRAALALRGEYGGQLRGRVHRPRGDQGAREAARVLLLAVLPQHPRDVLHLPLVDDLARRQLGIGRLVHAHVERAVAHEREASGALVDLMRGDAEVDEQPVEQARLPRPRRQPYAAQRVGHVREV
eukprot:scaffold8936_cov61-Phaeocystis_antarctica.AAC.14